MTVLLFAKKPKKLDHYASEIISVPALLNKPYDKMRHLSIP